MHIGNICVDMRVDMCLENMRIENMRVGMLVGMRVDMCICLS